MIPVNATTDFLADILLDRIERAEEMLLAGEPTTDLDHYRWLSISWCLTEDRPRAAAAILTNLKLHAARIADRDLADRLLITLDLPSISNRHTPHVPCISATDLPDCPSLWDLGAADLNEARHEA